MTITKAGTKLIALTLYIFATFNPVIILIMPPQALKSAIMISLTNGVIAWAKKKHIINIINCGTHMRV